MSSSAIDPVRRMLLERLQGVLAGPHDPPMPVPGHPEHVRGQVADLVGQLLLTDAGADHRASLDLVEQLRRLGLGVEKPFRADTSSVGLHRIDARRRAAFSPTAQSRDAPACSSRRG